MNKNLFLSLVAMSAATLPAAAGDVNVSEKLPGSEGWHADSGVDAGEITFTGGTLVSPNGAAVTCTTQHLLPGTYSIDYALVSGTQLSYSVDPSVGKVEGEIGSRKVVITNPNGGAFDITFSHSEGAEVNKGFTVTGVKLQLHYAFDTVANALNNLSKRKANMVTGTNSPLAFYPALKTRLEGLMAAPYASIREINDANSYNGPAEGKKSAYEVYETYKLYLVPVSGTSVSDAQLKNCTLYSGIDANNKEIETNYKHAQTREIAKVYYNNAETAIKSISYGNDLYAAYAKAKNGAEMNRITDAFAQQFNDLVLPSETYVPEDDAYIFDKVVADYDTKYAAVAFGKLTTKPEKLAGHSALEQYYLELNVGYTMPNGGTVVAKVAALKDAINVSRGADKIYQRIKAHVTGVKPQGLEELQGLQNPQEKYTHSVVEASATTSSYLSQNIVANLNDRREGNIYKAMLDRELLKVANLKATKDLVPGSETAANKEFIAQVGTPSNHDLLNGKSSEEEIAIHDGINQVVVNILAVKNVVGEDGAYGKEKKAFAYHKGLVDGYTKNVNDLQGKYDANSKYTFPGEKAKKVSVFETEAKDAIENYLQFIELHNSEASDWNLNTFGVDENGLTSEAAKLNTAAKTATEHFLKAAGVDVQNKQDFEFIQNALVELNLAARLDSVSDAKNNITSQVAMVAKDNQLVAYVYNAGEQNNPKALNDTYKELNTHKLNQKDVNCFLDAAGKKVAYNPSINYAGLSNLGTVSRGSEGDITSVSKIAELVTALKNHEDNAAATKTTIEALEKKLSEDKAALDVLKDAVMANGAYITDENSNKTYAALVEEKDAAFKAVVNDYTADIQLINKVSVPSTNSNGEKNLLVKLTEDNKYLQVKADLEKLLTEYQTAENKYIQAQAVQAAQRDYATLEARKNAIEATYQGLKLGKAGKQGVEGGVLYERQQAINLKTQLSKTYAFFKAYTGANEITEANVIDVQGLIYDVKKESAAVLATVEALDKDVNARVAVIEANTAAFTQLLGEGGNLAAGDVKTVIDAITTAKSGYTPETATGAIAYLDFTSDLNAYVETNIYKADYKAPAESAETAVVPSLNQIIEDIKNSNADTEDLGVKKDEYLTKLSNLRIADVDGKNLNGADPVKGVDKVGKIEEYVQNLQDNDAAFAALIKFATTDEAIKIAGADWKGIRLYNTAYGAESTESAAGPLQSFPAQLNTVTTVGPDGTSATITLGESTAKVTNETVAKRFANKIGGNAAIEKSHLNTLKSLIGATFKGETEASTLTTAYKKHEVYSKRIEIKQDIEAIQTQVNDDIKNLIESTNTLGQLDEKKTAADKVWKEAYVLVENDQTPGKGELSNQLGEVSVKLAQCKTNYDKDYTDGVLEGVKIDNTLSWTDASYFKQLNDLSVEISNIVKIVDPNQTDTQVRIDEFSYEYYYSIVGNPETGVVGLYDKVLNTITSTLATINAYEGLTNADLNREVKSAVEVASSYAARRSALLSARSTALANKQKVDKAFAEHMSNEVSRKTVFEYPNNQSFQTAETQLKKLVSELELLQSNAKEAAQAWLVGALQNTEGKGYKPSFATSSYLGLAYAQHGTANTEFTKNNQDERISQATVDQYLGQVLNMIKDIESKFGRKVQYDAAKSGEFVQTLDKYAYEVKKPSVSNKNLAELSTVVVDQESPLTTWIESLEEPAAQADWISYLGADKDNQQVGAQNMKYLVDTYWNDKVNNVFVYVSAQQEAEMEGNYNTAKADFIDAYNNCTFYYSHFEQISGYKKTLNGKFEACQNAYDKAYFAVEGSAASNKDWYRFTKEVKDGVATEGLTPVANNFADLNVQKTAFDKYVGDYLVVSLAAWTSTYANDFVSKYDGLYADLAAKRLEGSLTNHLKEIVNPNAPKKNQKSYETQYVEQLAGFSKDLTNFSDEQAGKNSNFVSLYKKADQAMVKQLKLELDELVVDYSKVLGIKPDFAVDIEAKVTEFKKELNAIFTVPEKNRPNDYYKDAIKGNETPRHDRLVAIQEEIAGYSHDMALLIQGADYAANFKSNVYDVQLAEVSEGNTQLVSNVDKCAYKAVTNDVKVSMNRDDAEGRMDYMKAVMGKMIAQPSLYEATINAMLTTAQEEVEGANNDFAAKVGPFNLHKENAEKITTALNGFGGTIEGLETELNGFSHVADKNKYRKIYGVKGQYGYEATGDETITTAIRQQVETAQANSALTMDLYASDAEPSLVNTELSDVINKDIQLNACNAIGAEISGSIGEYYIAKQVTTGGDKPQTTTVYSLKGVEIVKSQLIGTDYTKYTNEETRLKGQYVARKNYLEKLDAAFADAREGTFACLTTDMYGNSKNYNKEVTLENAYGLYQELKESLDGADGLHAQVNTLANNVNKDNLLVGDVDGDKLYTSLDYDIILDAVNNIYPTFADELEKQRFMFRANANQDNSATINVGDIVAIASFMRGERPHDVVVKSLVSKFMHGVNDNVALTVEGEGTSQRIAINLNNARSYVAGQMDIVLPAGVTLVGHSVSDRTAAHGVAVTELENGAYRVVVASQNNAVIEQNDGAIVYLDVEVSHNYNGEGLEVSNIVFADGLARTYSFDSIAGGEATGVGSVTLTQELKSKVYNLGGQLMNGLKKGVNIIKMQDGSVKKILKK